MTSATVIPPLFAPVSVRDGLADELPLEDQCCDTAIASLVLCSVPDMTKLDSYLEELFVVPDRRGQGIGRALMDAAIDVARDEGAADMSLGTGEDDVAARALYESLGFSDRECDGALNFSHERELLWPG